MYLSVSLSVHVLQDGVVCITMCVSDVVLGNMLIISITISHSLIKVIEEWAQHW